MRIPSGPSCLHYSINSCSASSSIEGTIAVVEARDGDEIEGKRLVLCGSRGMDRSIFWVAGKRCKKRLIYAQVRTEIAIIG
jgi:hypothetical protein